MKTETIVDIDYNQRMNRMRRYLDHEDFDIVVKEAGTLLEIALKELYEYVQGHLNAHQRSTLDSLQDRIGGKYRDYRRMGLGSLIALFREGDVLRLLEAHSRQDFSAIARVDINSIVDVRARNAATHGGVIPPAERAEMSYYNLRHFLVHAHLMDPEAESPEATPNVPATPRAQYEEALKNYYHIELGIWAKGHATPEDMLRAEQVAQQLQLTPDDVATQREQARQTCQLAIQAYQQHNPAFAPPEPPVYLRKTRYNLPSVLTRELQQGLKEYLEATFPVANPTFQKVLADCVEAPGRIFKGPFLSVKFPFCEGERPLTSHFPILSQPYMPYLHQEQAYLRLGQDTPRPTLVATGTGSGKTECFMHPILQYCYNQREQRGIKAILIYPMNALATDQSRRLARDIDSNPALRGKISAGLYIGGQDKGKITMGPDHLITDRDTLRQSPPDILVTNYKMLDYLLTRPDDVSLWQYNTPETLQYLVVDEIHTFDGAQGTDLACLIRRLKARLHCPPNYLCTVGTSATLGDKSATSLLAYATQVFGETFDHSALITEQRQDPNTFFADTSIGDYPVIQRHQKRHLDAQSYPDYATYIAAQYALWFGQPFAETSEQDWRHALGQQLKTHRFFYNLMKQLQGAPKAYDVLLKELSVLHQELKPEHDRDDFGVLLLNSMVALISSARYIAENGALSPFLQVRSQLWLRELKRVQAVVGPDPQLRFEADPRSDADPETLLPLVHCRACHYMAWGTVNDRQRHYYNRDLSAFYNAFFGGNQETVLLYPDSEQIPLEHGEALKIMLCPQCLSHAPATEAAYFQHAAGCAHEQLLSVTRLHPFTAEQRNHHRKSKDCAICHTENSLSVVGSQASSLSSVGIGQIFGSPFNADKKLIAFSDSVQDASHRAGFFTARSYVFNLRSAMAQFMAQHSQQTPDAPLTLAKFYGAFSDYWLRTLGDLGFITTFLPADMYWLQSYDTLLKEGKLPKDGDLLAKTTQRLDWELYRELTFRSRIGRTLERSNLLSLEVPASRYLPVLQALLERIPEHFPALGEGLTLKQLQGFVQGLLYRMKSRGAVYHQAIETVFSTPLKFGIYTSQRKGKGPLYLPRHLGYVGPVPLSERNTDFDAIRLQRGTSYTGWLAQKFLYSVDNLLAMQELEPAVMYILEGLQQAKILRVWHSNKGKLWAINPDELVVQSALAPIRCHRCQHTLNVPEAQLEQWLQQPCLQQPCAEGLYQHYAQGEQNFYHQYYQRAEIGRILSAEHTGLLTRQNREQVEREFMASETQRQPWYPNLLSCTPTMEMGIDIGDLSSVLLCQVPPAQSNYLQRIGRSGRKDGNSLNLTLATAQPHDLYYFNDPLEMIAGHVEPPGVYLEAAAVLERQFIAYCFDRWVASGLDPKALPRRFQQLMGHLKNAESEQFPFNFFHFVQAHRNAFVQAFCALFADVLSAEVFAQMYQHIAAFAGDAEAGARATLEYKMLESLSYLAQEVNNYERDLKRLNQQIKTLEQQPAQDDHTRQLLDDMQREREGLRKIRDEIKKKSLFNLLTEEGLLPNYAFPEEGVTLRSIVYRKQEQHTSQGKPYEVFEYAYQRPAAAALRELAPNNQFFAGGRRITIDQVELRFRGEGNSLNESSADIEHWRFCNACTYMRQEHRQEETELEKACPRCGSTLWRDQGQLRDLIRMRQVFSNMSLQESLSGDDSDERAVRVYEQALLVNFEPEDIRQAYLCEHPDFPFGFEFIEKVQLREVNFGEGEGGLAEFQVNGQQLCGAGFVLCRFCGKVQPHDARQHESKQRHSPICRRGQRKSDDVLIESAYLYRNFQSEALRIFLPDTGTRRLGVSDLSFTAAMLVGLKAFFSGNVDHLQAAPYHEPIAGEGQRSKNYLVLYDTVPGGTGYLKQLTVPGAFYTLCQKALDILQNCSCQHQNNDPDGCYRCIYTYRHKHNLEQLSRNTAIELLQAVLRHQKDMVPTRNISEIDSNSLLESELERLFIETLQASSQKSGTVKTHLLKSIINGKQGFTLTIGEKHYQIEPQVSLGEAEGVAVPSRCDFLLTDLDEAAIKIAVFTDGYQYHKDRVALDFAQRMALVKAGFVTWSLSWEDVKAKYEDLQSDAQKTVDPHFFWNPLQAFDKIKTSLTTVFMKQKELSLKALQDQPIERENAMEHFLRFLAFPEIQYWQNWLKYQIFAGVPANTLRLKAGQQSPEEAPWCEQLRQQLPDSLQHLADPTGDHYLSHCPPEYTVSSYTRVARSWLQNQSLLNTAEDNQAQVFILSPTAEKKVWNGFLRLYNLYQFLPQSYFLGTLEPLTPGQLEQLEHLFESPLPRAGMASSGARPSAGESSAQDTEQWSSAFGMCDEDMLPLLEALKLKRWPVPEVGYEAHNEKGKILGGIVELAYPDRRLAFILPDQIEEIQVYQELGWELVVYEDQDPVMLLSSYASAEETAQ